MSNEYEHLSTKQRIIKNISKNMFIREDVIEDVVNQFINEIIVETVKTGSMNIDNFISISCSKWGSYKISNRNERIEEHWRLKARISKNLRTLFKYFGPYSKYPNVITATNWRKLLEFSKTIKKGEQPILDKKSTHEEPHKTVNPFL